MLHDGFVALPVEEGRHAADRLNPGLGGVFGQLDGPRRRGRADVHYVLDPASRLVGYDLGDAHVFFVFQKHALTGASGYPESMHPGLDVELDDLPKRRLIELATSGHGSD